jgi:DNA-binding PadR family transcriptional regulator
MTMAAGKKYNRMFPATIGTTNFLVVYMLHLFVNANAPMYGKEIIDKLTERFAGSWKPSHGIVYPKLRELESEGYLSGYWEPHPSGNPRKKTQYMYEITDSGRELYSSDLSAYESKITESLDMITKIVSDLYNKAGESLTVKDGDE